MIKLQDILKEEKTFKAKSKETGRIVVYKSKEARDKAIKAGKSEPVDKKKSDKQVKGKSLFQKQMTAVDPETGKPKDTSKNLKSDNPQQFVIDVRKMKGEHDLNGVKIKDGKMFDADGNEMDDDDIEDFYYQDGYDEKGINVGIDMSPKKEKSEDEIFKPRDDSWVDDYSEKNPKWKRKMDKKYRNKNHTSDDYYRLMLGVEEKIKEVRSKWIKENPGKRIPGTLTTNLEDEVEYLQDSSQKMAAHETGNDYGDTQWSYKWGTAMDKKHNLRNKKEVNEKYLNESINLLNESKVWERKFGEPLPTLNSVMEKHQQNQLNESPVSVLKPAKVEKNSIIYGYINLKAYYNALRKSWKELRSLLNRIDYIAIDFDDRNQSLNAVSSLGGWRDEFFREPMLTSFKNFTKFVNNPKNMTDPKRVQNAISKNIRQSALPKWKQLTNLYKQYLKFNNKKVSSVFKQTKGKKIGQKRIGDFGGFELTQDVHKLLTNQSGFTQSDVNDAFKQMDYDIEKGSARKIMVRGPRD